MNPPTALRWRLRDATMAAHARLDARIGDALDDADGYAAFLQGMYRFLSAAADATGEANWAASRAALAADLADLGAPLPDVLDATTTPAAATGWRYVVAGASLGARVLLPRVSAHGPGIGEATRYLASQSQGGAWRALLVELEGVAPQEAEAVIEGAQAAFACAERCMADAMHAVPA